MSWGLAYYLLDIVRVILIITTVVGGLLTILSVVLKLINQELDNLLDTKEDK